MVKRESAQDLVSRAKDTDLHQSAGNDDKVDAPSPSGNDKKTHSQLLKSQDELKRERVFHYEVDPRLVRIPEDHDRNYSLLNEENCQDLITGFRADKQILPAIVTEITGEDSGPYRWDLICGARRHWTAIHLNCPLVIEVRHNIDKKEAFILSDQENRSRKDISDYERATKYQKALNTLFKNATQLRTNLGLSSSFMSYLLLFADAPKELVRVVDNINELSERNYRAIRPIIFDPETKQLYPEVIVFLKQQADNSLKAETLKSVFSDLLKQQQKKDDKSKEQFVRHDVRTGKVALTVKNDPNRKVVNLNIHRSSLDDPEGLLNHIKEALEEITRSPKDNQPSTAD